MGGGGGHAPETICGISWYLSVFHARKCIITHCVSTVGVYNISRAELIRRS